MSLHRNRVQVAVTAAPGTGTIALGAAYPGYQSFAQAYGINALVDILIVEGTNWEVCRACNYNHATQTVTRGTLEDGSNGTGSRITFGAGASVSVVATAGWANDVEDFLNAESQVVKTHGQIVGNGTATSFAIPHNLDSLNIVVLIRTTAAPIVKVEESAYDVTFQDGNNLTVTFATAPTTGQYEIFCATFATGGVIVPPSLGGKQIYDTAGVYSFVVPSAVTTLTAKVWGAGGGGAALSGAARVGGGGGFGSAEIAVVPGEVLTIRVGAGGAAANFTGWTGLANYTTNCLPSFGGDLCGVFRGATLLSSTPLVIGGSGAGAGLASSTTTTNYTDGGAGGGSSGTATGVSNNGATGGTQVSGGAAGVTSPTAQSTAIMPVAGSYLGTGTQGGRPGNYSTSNNRFGVGGGGGGGYYSGGGGGASAGDSNTSARGAGGGGGSGYVPSVGSPLLASGAPAPTLTAGSGQTPAGQSDSDYGLTNAGLGGGGGANGNPGRVVLIW